MRYEYWKSENGTWSWHLRTSIGDVIARGTPFSSRDNCLSAIKLVKLANGAPCRDVSPAVLEISTEPSSGLRSYSL